MRLDLSEEQYQLYKLIWQKCGASQMMPAVFDQTTVEIEAKAKSEYNFRSTGSVLEFDGCLYFEERSVSCARKRPQSPRLWRTQSLRRS